MGDLPERVLSFEKRFPGLRHQYKVTSPRTRVYNCFAYAAGEQQVHWSPGACGLGGDYWPDGAPRAVTLDAFIAAYATVGYAPCENGELEPDVEKIAIYVRNGQPSHAARQLPSGRWTSKIADLEDIEHSLGALEGEMYGTVEQFLARPFRSGTSATDGV